MKHLKLYEEYFNLHPMPKKITNEENELLNSIDGMNFLISDLLFSADLDNPSNYNKFDKDIANKKINIFNALKRLPKSNKYSLKKLKKQLLSNEELFDIVIKVIDMGLIVFDKNYLK